MSTPKVSVVIATLGDRESLKETLSSLGSQTLPPFEVVVVNQGDPGLVNRIISEYPDLNVSMTTSPPGLSRARNKGLRTLSPEWEYVATPDDDVILRPQAIELLVARLSCGDERIGAASALLVDHRTGRTRLRFPGTPERLNRKTVWTGAIEAAILYSRAALDDAGFFDESLGLGSGTVWGSGEGTDLLLRIMDAGYQVWSDPTAVMSEINAAAATSSTSIERVRSYARGTGRVFALRETRVRRAQLLVRSVARLALLLPFAQRRQMAAAILHGRYEGLRSGSA